jgi:hypothetical protein
MAGALTDADRRRYEDAGYLAPMRVLTAEEASSYRDRLDEFIDECTATGPGAEVLRTKAHLHCSAVLELVHLPAIVERVGDLLGPDLLCRSASIFTKEPDTPAYVAWHQDAAYWDLEPPDVATAWVAITPATVQNGALQVLPGSHRSPLLAHHTVDDPANMLSRGQAIAETIDAASTRTLVLAAGEMSIHDVRIAHASSPNRSRARRIGVAIRYVAPHVRKTGPRRDSAILVCGRDRYGNFDVEPVQPGSRRSPTR